MKNICVVTGGGSGMGLDAAKLVGKDQKIILVGRTVSKLEGALKELHDLGIDAEAFPCDASDITSVQALAEYASKLGNIKTVIHAAGVSPTMTNAEKIFDINAVGTININETFLDLMSEGGVVLNVSSMSAYMSAYLGEALPALKEIYKLSLTDKDAFKASANAIFAMAPEEGRAGMAYTASKNFVCWYTEKMALKYGRKGIRVVSISPGTFSTPMGNAEGEAAASFAKAGALGRVGDPMEIAKMMAFMVSDECSYLTGVDILYDGGSVAAFNEMMANLPKQ